MVYAVETQCLASQISVPDQTQCIASQKIGSILDAMHCVSTLNTNKSPLHFA